METTTADTCTIYLLTNSENGKLYVGQTWLPLVKRMGHNGSNYRNSKHLYSAMIESGAHKFYYTILATTDNQDEANKLECEYITFYKSKDPTVGYNIKDGGSNGKHSEETKKLISDNHARAFLGQHHTEETKQILSELMSGRILKKEHRDQVVLTLQPGAFEGHHHTQETKDHLSELFKGIPRNPELVAKTVATRRSKKADRVPLVIADYQSGMNISDIEEKYSTSRSAIYRILNENKIPRLNNFKKGVGRKHNEDTKEKMSESAKQIWEERKSK